MPKTPHLQPRNLGTRSPGFRALNLGTHSPGIRALNLGTFNLGTLNLEPFTLNLLSKNDLEMLIHLEPAGLHGAHRSQVFPGVSREPVLSALSHARTYKPTQPAITKHIHTPMPPDWSCHHAVIHCQVDLSYYYGRIDDRSAMGSGPYAEWMSYFTVRNPRIV